MKIQSVSNYYAFYSSNKKLKTKKYHQFQYNYRNLRNEGTIKYSNDAISATRLAEINFGAKKIKTNKKTFQITAEIGKLIVASCAAGVSIDKIANEIGCSEKDVSDYLKLLPDFKEQKSEQLQNLNSSGYDFEKDGELIRTDYIQGKTIEQIASHIGSNKSAIYKFLKQQADWKEIQKIHNSISKRGPKVRITEEFINKIVAEYVEGKSGTQIAKQLNKKKATIFQYLYRLPNWKEIQELHNKKISKVSDHDAEIRELYVAGVFITKIAEQIGYPVFAVIAYLHKQSDWEDLYIKHCNSLKRKPILRIDKEIGEKIKREYTEGKTAMSIAKQVGSNTSTICRYLKQQPDWEEIHEQHNHFKSKIRAFGPMIISSYKEGQLVKIIAQKVGRSETAILNYLRKQPNWDEMHAQHSNLRNYKRRQNITPDIGNTIKMLYADGKTLAQIAKETGYTDAAISKYLLRQPDIKKIKAKHNIFHKKNKKLFIDKIKLLYTEGQLANTIAEQVGCSSTKVIKILQKQSDWKELEDKHINARKNSQTQFEEKIAKLYEEGCSVATIAAQTNRSIRIISDILHNLTNWNELKIKHNATLENNKKPVIDKIKILYAEGHSAEKIAEQVEYGSTQITTILQKQPDWKELEEKHINAQKNRRKQFIDNIVKLYKEGNSVATIAAQVNRSSDNIRDILHSQANWNELKAINKSKTKPYSKLNKNKEIGDEIIKAYKQGQYIEDLAKMFHYSEHTIIKYLRQQPDWEQMHEIHEKVKSSIGIYGEMIKAAYTDGQEIIDIAAQIGCGRDTVSRYLHKQPNFEEMQKSHLSKRNSKS